MGYGLYFDVKKGIILNEVYAIRSKKELEEHFEKVNLTNYHYKEM